MRHRRAANWHVPLEAVINKWATASFEYSKHDCCTFANEVIKELIGIDMMDDHSDYDCEEDVLRKLHKAGGLEPLVEQQAKKYNLTEVGISYAQRGDLLLMDHRAGHNCGIMWLNGSVACAGLAGGIIFLPIEVAHRAWRIA